MSLMFLTREELAELTGRRHPPRHRACRCGDWEEYEMKDLVEVVRCFLSVMDRKADPHEMQDAFRDLRAALAAAQQAEPKRDTRVCHAPGDRCGGCDHYYGRADRCVYAPAEQKAEQTSEPVALTWYDGAPPFPQDQEWFIAETKHGDRAVLRALKTPTTSHEHAYDFTTADGTYMLRGIIARWMQFPNCEYIPPTTSEPRPVVRLTEEEREEIMDAWDRPTPTMWGDLFDSIESAVLKKNGMEVE